MRLVDSDELIKELKSLSIVLSGKQIFSDDAKDTVLRVINEQPTAYDIDKVVEQLEEIRVKKTCNKEKCDSKELCRICVVDDAIEIVKQGGVSDDVCEWRLCDEEANVYDTSCRNPHILIEGTPKENNYEFCPYCGKKIKVVE